MSNISKKFPVVKSISRKIEELNDALKRQARKQVGNDVEFHQFLSVLVTLQKNSAEFQRLIKEFESEIPKEESPYKDG
jgi:hypothetical protein